VTQRALLETGRARSFPEMRRVQQSWVACAEKRALLWLAARTPSWIGSDHMTMLGLVSQIGAGACYALAPWNRYALLGVIAWLALNRLGDSLRWNAGTGAPTIASSLRLLCGPHGR
jgi:hypothetical protein